MVTSAASIRAARSWFEEPVGKVTATEGLGIDDQDMPERSRREGTYLLIALPASTLVVSAAM